MAAYNKVILIGNLVRDPELTYTPKGTALTKFTLAVSRKYKEKETVAFIDITVWFKVAELVAEYMGKGNSIMVEGYLQQDMWTSGGQKRSKLSVTAEKVVFMPGNKDKKKDDGAGTNAEPVTDTPF